jgi:glutamate formiminotransferase
LYGPERTLPYIRKHAFVDLLPDYGPANPHPTAGAMCVGARPILVAYNIWLKDSTLQTAKDICKQLRSDSVRTLGLQVGPSAQVSMNLIAPEITGPMAEIPRARWAELDLSNEKTIEWKLAQRNRTLQS